MACFRHYLESQEKEDFSLESLLAGERREFSQKKVLLIKGNSRGVFLSIPCGSSLSFPIRLMWS
jgi:hypothetical protein